MRKPPKEAPSFSRGEHVTNLESRALDFATEAHKGQERKYTGEPYIRHPIAVAALVASVTSSTPEMVAAAYLHDVVEDCGVSMDQIYDLFGDDVGDLVRWLTDTTKPSDGNRAARVAINRERLSRAPAAAQTIKLADMIDNLRSIRQHDPDFWKVYRREKEALLGVMRYGSPVLMTLALAHLGKE